MITFYLFWFKSSVNYYLSWMLTPSNYNQIFYCIYCIYLYPSTFPKSLTHCVGAAWPIHTFPWKWRNILYYWQCAAVFQDPACPCSHCSSLLLAMAVWNQILIISHWRKKSWAWVQLEDKFYQCHLSKIHEHWQCGALVAKKRCTHELCFKTQLVHTHITSPLLAMAVWNQFLNISHGPKKSWVKGLSPVWG